MVLKEVRTGEDACTDQVKQLILIPEISGFQLKTAFQTVKSDLSD
jgi:hypothetical protein